MMVEELVGAHWVVVRPYPHMMEGTAPWWQRIRFGGVRYLPKRRPTPREDAAISLAPRIPNLIAVVLTPLSALLPGNWAILWLLVWGSGLIDLAYGSIGFSPFSDLRKAAENLEISPWLLRGLGFLFVSLSACWTLYLWLIL
jgi:hypothetical protein